MDNDCAGPKTEKKNYKQKPSCSEETVVIIYALCSVNFPRLAFMHFTVYLILVLYVEYTGKKTRIKGNINKRANSAFVVS